MTHSELVDRAGIWLKNTFNCRVVLKELVAYTRYGETPDVIGWIGNRSILVECKTSVADYRKDLKKVFRYGARGLGNYRFYLTGPDLLKSEELLEGWGLYEAHGKKFKYVKGIEYKNAQVPPFKSDRDSEVAMLVSALGRKRRKEDNSNSKSGHWSCGEIKAL